MSRAHSPTFPSLYLRHSSFSNPSAALPTSQLILQPLRCFIYVTAHSPTFLSFLLRHWLFTYVTCRSAHDIKNGWDTRSSVSDICEQSSFSNLSDTSPTSQLILQTFRHFSYVTALYPTLLLLHLRHSSFSNPSVASPTSQYILQPFFRFSYVTGSSLKYLASRPRCKQRMWYQWPSKWHLFIYWRSCATSKVRNRRRPKTDDYDVDDKWCPHDTEGRMWPKFPDICIAVEENRGKTSTKKLSRPEVQHGHTGRAAMTLPSGHSGGQDLQ